MCEGVASILLIVQILHHLVGFKSFRFHIPYVLHEILQGHATQLSRHPVGGLPRAYILKLFMVVEMQNIAQARQFLPIIIWIRLANNLLDRVVTYRRILYHFLELFQSIAAIKMVSSVRLL